MNEAANKLTVFFEDPFWVGVFERTEEGRLSVCKVTFGAEPKDAEVLQFVLRRYSRLCFGPSVAAPDARPCGNPKRVRREVRRQTAQKGVGTRSQQALQLQWEQAKQQRSERKKEERQLEKERRFAQKQQKKKEKHRGH